MQIFGMLYGCRKWQWTIWKTNSRLIITLQFTNHKFLDSFEFLKFLISNLKAHKHYCACRNFCFSFDTENVWRNNDLTFISTVAEPVSRDYELHSLVSPRDNSCISRCYTDRRSIPSGLFLSVKHDYPKLVQHSGLVSFTIELQARFTYEWHVTLLRSSDMTS